jgi:hypothetical protein
MWVEFNQRMSGRFAPGANGEPGKEGEVQFTGDPRSVTTRVGDEFATIDPDRPPGDFKILVSRTLRLRSEPSPSGSEKPNHLLLIGDNDAAVQTRDKAMKGDRITYDSLTELFNLYGTTHGVLIVNQSSPGQPASFTRGTAVQYNHLTGQGHVINPNTFQIFDPRGGARAAVPDDPKPAKIQRPPSLYKPPMRNDKERRSFSGR